jgi:PAS domain S-box-containing protein
MNLNLKILVVDNNSELLAMTERLLKKTSYNIYTAMSGQECYQAIQLDKPDILMLDVLLPDGNGMDICNKIKSNPELSSMYIFLLSGWRTEPENISEGLETGADGYLIHPLTDRELLAHIDAAVRIIQAERALRKSEEKYRTLFTEMIEGFALHEIICDENGKPVDYRFLEMNPAFETMTGLSAQAVIGKTALEVLPNMEKYWIETYGQVALIGKSLSFDSFSVELNRHFRVMAFSNSPGQFVTVFEDITKRKSDELAIQQTTEALTFLAQYSRTSQESDFFRLLAEYLAKALEADFVCIDSLEGDKLNARTVAVWCDGVFEDNVVYALEDTPCGVLVGKSVCCFPASVCQFFPKDTVLQDLKAESYVGATLWSHTGNPIGLIAVIKRKKLSNQVQAEDLLKLVVVRAAGEMERLEAEKVILLKNEELENSTAEKDKFYSIIAHDLRGPFNGFLGLTQIMAEELPDLPMAEAQKIAVSMKNSAIGLYSLLENLLEWSQIQQGTIQFCPEAIQLGQKLNESIAMYSESAKAKGIEVVLDIPERLEVFGDLNMFQTTIRNLVSNALKFTARGGKVTVSAKLNFDKSVEIFIEDTGVGMSQEMIKKLFKIDLKTNRKGTEGESSSGLGLLLCKEFVEKNGGEILVRSEEGKGSTFSFTIPGIETEC